MAESTESRWDVELATWGGFATADEVSTLLSSAEFLEGSAALEQSEPALLERVSGAVDLVQRLRVSPSSLVPTSALGPAANALQGLRDNLVAARDQPENAANYARQVLAHADALITNLSALVAPESIAELASILQSVRETAQSAIRGVRTSAGKAMNDIKASAEGVGADLDKHRQTLEVASRESVETMNREAAEARSRMEAGLDATRVNGEAEISTLRETAEQVKARIDQDYESARQRFDEDTQRVAELRESCSRELESAYETWGGNLQAWADEHMAAANRAREALEEVREWADGVVGGVQIAALAEGFHLKEVDHRKRAGVALRNASLLAAAGFLSAIVAFWLFYKIKTDASASEVARDVALRIALAIVPLTAAVFAARVYRTHSHLATVYGERAAAAKAFEGFAKRASNPDVADQLLVALAQLVFAGRDTGHHSEEQILPVSAASAAFGGLLPRK